MICDQLHGIAIVLPLPESHDLVGSIAQAFMTPPFTSRRLLYRVRKVAASLPCRKIRAVDLLLDPDAAVRHKGGVAVRLLPKEIALLALSVRNRDKVLSRQEIKSRAWDTGSLNDTRNLTVHVRWLRLKIQDEPNALRYLRTQTWRRGKLPYNRLETTHTRSCGSQPGAGKVRNW